MLNSKNFGGACKLPAPKINSHNTTIPFNRVIVILIQVTNKLILPHSIQITAVYNAAFPGNTDFEHTTSSISNVR